jgi:hypothetical protein
VKGFGPSLAVGHTGWSRELHPAFREENEIRRLNVKSCEVWSAACGKKSVINDLREVPLTASCNPDAS